MSTDQLWESPTGKRPQQADVEVVWALQALLAPSMGMKLLGTATGKSGGFQLGKEFCASRGNCLHTMMVNVKLSPNKALAKAQSHSFPMVTPAFVSSSAWLQKQRQKRKIEDTARRAQELRGYPSHSDEIWSEHLCFIPVRLTWYGGALGMISMCTFPQHPSPLSVPSSCSPEPPPSMTKDTQRAPWSSCGRGKSLINLL